MSKPGNQRTLEPGYSYRNLALWQQAQDFAQAIIELVEQLPTGRSTDTMARQLAGAATSIAANIAEGHGRFSLPSYRNHLSIAKGSACEADSWLDLLRRLGLLAPDREAELHQRCSALIAALTRRIRDLERVSAKTVREEPAIYGTADELGEPLSPDGSQVQGFQGSPGSQGSSL